MFLGRSGYLVVDALRQGPRRLLILSALGADVWVLLPDWSRFVFGNLAWGPVPAHRMWVDLGRCIGIAHAPSWLVWRTSAAVSITHTSPLRQRAFVKSRDSQPFERIVRDQQRPEISDAYTPNNRFRLAAVEATQPSRNVGVRHVACDSGSALPVGVCLGCVSSCRVLHRSREPPAPTPGFPLESGNM